MFPPKGWIVSETLLRVMIQFNKEIINLQLVIPPENLCQEKFKKSNKLSDTYYKPWKAWFLNVIMITVVILTIKHNKTRVPQFRNADTKIIQMSKNFTIWK